MMQGQPSPLFSTDLAGVIRALLMIGGPIFAAALLYLRAGTRERLAGLKRDCEEADAALDKAIAEVKREAERRSDSLKGDLNGFGGRMDNLVAEMTRIRTDVDNVKTSITESQRDVMQAITSSSEAQLRAVHASDMAAEQRSSAMRESIARLQERDDVASKLADSIDRLGKMLIESRRDP